MVFGLVSNEREVVVVVVLVDTTADTEFVFDNCLWGGRDTRCLEFKAAMRGVAYVRRSSHLCSF